MRNRNPRKTPRGQGALQPSFTGYTAPRTVTTSQTAAQATLMGEPPPVPRTLPPRTTAPSNNPVPASSAPATNTTVGRQIKQAGQSLVSGAGGGATSFTPPSFAQSGGGTSTASPGGDYLVPALIGIGGLVLLAFFLKR